MLKKLLVAVAAVSGGLAAVPAMAAPAFKCEPAVINVGSVGASAAQYLVECYSANTHTVAPVVTFSGEVSLVGTAPYMVDATYRIDMRSGHAKTVGQEAYRDQLATGRLLSSTESLATLPVQFASQTEWDAASSMLSIQERPGIWRSFSVRNLVGAGETLTDAGVASTPVVNGKASYNLLFGQEFSRFSAKGAGAPVLQAQLGIRDGVFEVLVGESRVQAQDGLQDALLMLDKRPKDIARAWNLAARAQFLGMEDEVRYAESKVAAHNPNLLEEFHLNVQRIQPYTLTQVVITR